MMRFLRAALPGLVIVVSAVVTLVSVGGETLEAVTGQYIFVAYGAGLLLAVLFHRSRVAVAVLALTYLHVTHLGDALGDRMLPAGTATLVLLGGFSLTRDRGIRSRAGVLQLGIASMFLGLVHVLLQDPVALATFAEVELLPGWWPVQMPYPDVTVEAAGLSIVFGALAIARWRGAVERALFWTQLLLLTAMYPGFGDGQADWLLMGGGVILILSVLEQSYFMAYRDELTGLPARRALMRDLSEISGLYTIAMVDVDHFKKFNDTHGHDVGDQVLQLVATRLSTVRQGRAYRYGGEEFTLLFPGLGREDSMEPADEARRAVGDAAFALRSWNRPRKRPKGEKGKSKAKKKRVRMLSVTVSIGLADSTAADPSPEAILKKADQALYRAKEGGRNQVAK